MITELAVEQVEFTCRHYCPRQWSVDFDVQALKTQAGGVSE